MVFSLFHVYIFNSISDVLPFRFDFFFRVNLELTNRPKDRLNRIESVECSTYTPLSPVRRSVGYERDLRRYQRQSRGIVPSDYSDVRSRPL